MSDIYDQMSSPDLVPSSPPTVPAPASPPGVSPSPGGGGPTSLMDMLTRAAAPIDPGVQQQFVDQKTGQIDQLRQLQQQDNAVFAKDRARAEKAFNLESAMIDHTPKWDAEEQKQKYATNPIEQFGSFASVFAMIASAFTKAPMENALNGAAAAMNAAREGNEREYQRAFDAWKSNTDLAVKRFNMQHAALGDAFSLMEKDAQHGQAQLRTTLAKFGMENELLLYHNGMIPEIQQIRDSQLKAIEGIQRAQIEVEKLHDQRQRTQLTASRDEIRAEIEAQKIKVAIERDENKRQQEQQKLDDLNQRFMRSFDQRQEGLDLRREESQTRAAQGGRRLDQQQSRSESQDEYRAKQLELQRDRLKAAEGKAGANEHLTPQRRLAGEQDRRYKFDQEHPDPNDPARAEEMNRRALWNAVTQQTALDAANGKNFTTQETRMLRSGPNLLGHLQIMDNLVSGVTNPLAGVPRDIAARYFGINDKVVLYQSAYDQARSEIMDYLGGSRTNKQGLEAAWNLMPKDYNSDYFARRKIQDTLSSFSQAMSTELNLIASEGKKVQPEDLDRFKAVGVYSAASRDQDPLQMFRKDPGSVPKDSLMTLYRLMGKLPVEDQQRVLDEINRRADELDARNRGPKALQ